MSVIAVVKSYRQPVPIIGHTAIDTSEHKKEEI
jgi:hypothetical protein